MTLDEVSKMRQRCMNALDEFSAPASFRKFCLEVVQYEEDASVATLRIHEKLRQVNTADVSCLEPLKSLLQNMLNDFTIWKRTIDLLVKTGASLPDLRIADQLHNKEIKASFSLETKQLQIGEGDIFKVIDASQVNVIKVRTRDGKEDDIPVLSCILPSSDKNISSLLQRLLVQLLSSWTDCLRQSSKLLFQSTKNCFQKLNLAKDKIPEVNGSTLIEQLKKSQDIVTELEREYALKTNAKDNRQNKEIVTNLTKTFNAYQLFYDSWNAFRLQLERRKPRPICIFENLDDFKLQVTQSKQIKYYTTIFTVESTETREEIVHVPVGEMDDDGGSSYGGSSYGGSSYGGASGGGSWRQTVEAEQLTSTSLEEKKRYIIRAVKDPRTGLNISLKESVRLGVMDMAAGLYVNPVTREVKPIVLAMNDGQIEVEYVSKSRSSPKTNAIGLITVRDQVERRKYMIQAVIDATSAEKVDLTEAKKRGLVDDDASYFIVNTTGERINMEDAIDSGWVIVEYESTEGESTEYTTKTYAIRAVVDQRLKKKVPFAEAVARRLIDKDTGNYINNVTGETVYVVNAIHRGFLKAKLIDDPSTMDIDPENKMVIEGIGRMKTIVTGLGALSAMKKSISNNS